MATLEEILLEHVARVEDLQTRAAGRLVALLVAMLDRLRTGEEMAAFVASLLDSGQLDKLILYLLDRVFEPTAREAQEIGGRTAAKLDGREFGSFLLDSLSPEWLKILRATMALDIKARFGLSVSEIQSLLRAGALIGRSARAVFAQLSDDARGGGPVLGWMTNARSWVNAIGASVGQAADRALATAAEMLRSGVSAAEADERVNRGIYRWITTGRDSCEPCMERHNELDTMSNWRERGLPQTSWGNPCGRNCNCTLIPTSAKLGGDPLNEPLDLLR